MMMMMILEFTVECNAMQYSVQSLFGLDHDKDTGYDFRRWNCTCKELSLILRNKVFDRCVDLFVLKEL